MGKGEAPAQSSTLLVPRASQGFRRFTHSATSLFIFVFSSFFVHFVFIFNFIKSPEIFFSPPPRSRNPLGEISSSSSFIPHSFNDCQSRIDNKLFVSRRDISYLFPSSIFLSLLVLSFSFSLFFPFIWEHFWRLHSLNSFSFLIELYFAF